MSRKVWLYLVLFLALIGAAFSVEGLSAQAASRPLPEAQDGKTVVPRAGYTIQWFARGYGKATIIRHPIGGRSRSTPRSGGAMAETGAYNPVGFTYNVDPGSGGAYCFGRYVPWSVWARFDWAPDYYGLYVCGGDGNWHYYGTNYRITWWEGIWSSQLVSTGVW